MLHVAFASMQYRLWEAAFIGSYSALRGFQARETEATESKHDMA
jgi:hypothetical protein